MTLSYFFLWTLDVHCSIETIKWVSTDCGMFFLRNFLPVKGSAPNPAEALELLEPGTYLPPPKKRWSFLSCNKIHLKVVKRLKMWGQQLK